MSALPGQTLESYERTLRKVLGLKPEHISAYSLIIEEGTKFYEWFGDGQEYNITVKQDGGILAKDKETQKGTQRQKIKTEMVEIVRNLRRDSGNCLFFV